MAPARPRARGLSAAELGAAVAELREHAGAEVLDATALRTAAGAEDLLLVLQPRDGAKRFLHVALGSDRARLAPTTRRFAKDTFAPGIATDVLRRELTGAVWTAIDHPAGERRCELTFRGPRGPRRLVVELFGSRGLWALLDADGQALALSRAVETAVRTLRPGDRYAPPPATGQAPTDEPPRFAAPALAAIDAFFQAVDRELGFTAEHDHLQVACRRALQKAQAKVTGLRTGLADAGRAAALRRTADLMLAFAGNVARGATEMHVPDPDHDGDTLRIELDPARPVVVQAQQRYEQARRLDDGRAIAERRLGEAEAALAMLQAIEQQLAAARPEDADDQLAAPRAALQRLGALPRPAAAPRERARTPSVPREENYRRFTSAEGYTILVGRDNTQNDRLTLRTANGNDVWLHVGGGRPGSHVVVRLPKQKTASLETLLDAATLAVHFSKARGEARVDVIYTLKKHVRKPKGLPPGAVVPSQTKTVTVRADAARLQRLLDGTERESD